ncbi:UBP9-binding protein [Yarrowia sp. C11]|nr:UBP9-binding protein [Yarrowia sp. E02]KAG5369393.1 UBP9-binding protein [Yarrowia sp. C11]
MRKSSKKLVYTLAPESFTNGHSLGVNSLCAHGDLLYSAGRDGVVNMWSTSKTAPTAFVAANQMHTHWVNDICSVNNGRSILSASSDLSVKLWTPSKNETVLVGHHRDYVKCIAERGEADPTWAATGGLDQQIIIWDLEALKQRAVMKPTSSNQAARSQRHLSLYSLAASSSGSQLVVGGGPDGIIRCWDAREPERVQAMLVGHTDNVRALVLPEDVGGTPGGLISASSDGTVRLWDVGMRKVVSTLDSHVDSVWSLSMTDPQTLYSADRSGLVIKTDLGRGLDVDSEVVCREHGSVNRVLAVDGSVWTATENSRIHRWADVTVRPGKEVSEAPEEPSEASRVKGHAHSGSHDWGDWTIKFHGDGKPEEQQAEAAEVAHTTEATPPSDTPSDTLLETLQGQNGLIKHKLLLNRRQVLAIDTAGEVSLWDLVLCREVQKFGKRDMEEVFEELMTHEIGVAWCQVQTKSGRLYVTLEENSFSDGEVYIDELGTDYVFPDDFVRSSASTTSSGLDNPDQRLNLGQWILTNLFSNLIDKQLESDTDYRRHFDEYRAAEDRAAAVALAAKVEKQLPPTPAEDPSAALNAANNVKEESSKFRLFGKKKRNSIVAAPTVNTTAAASATTNGSHKPSSPVATTRPSTAANAAAASSAAADVPPPNLEAIVTTTRAKYASSNDASLLKPPSFPKLDIPNVVVIISQYNSDFGENMDLVCEQRDKFSTHYNDLPDWVVNLLLFNQIPHKDPVKVNFTLTPEHERDAINPPRLSAYRMLRIKRITNYISDHLASRPNPDTIELACQGRVLGPKETLASVRSSWKTGGDVVINYRFV